MKTTISIPNTLFEAADRLARRLGISRGELYRRAVRKYVENHDHLIREMLDKIYGDEPDSGRLDPAIEYLQNASLAEDQW